MAEQSTKPAVLLGIAKVAKFVSDHGIEKARENKAQGFSFRGIDDVLNVMSTALVDAKLAILPTVREVKNGTLTVEKRNQRGETYTQVIYTAEVLVDYKILSLVDGSHEIVTFPGFAFDTSDKPVTKALSGAYKYMAIQTFCAPVQGLPDQDVESPDAQNAPAASAPAPSAAPKPDQLEADSVEQLKDGIRGAADEESLRAAFDVAKRFASNRKNKALLEEFVDLKDRRKQLIVDAAEEQAE